MRQNTKRCYGVWKILGRGYFEIAAMNKFKKNVRGGGKWLFPTQKMRSKKCEKKAPYIIIVKSFFDLLCKEIFCYFSR